MSDSSDLLRFVSAVSGDAFLKVEENLGEGYVRLKVSEAERRQAKHDIRSVEDIVVELLRNARDAHASRLFVATTRDGDRRLITVIDDGTGMPPAMHDKVFEPRVTSKLETMVVDSWGVHGRGMALFSIKSNAQEATIAVSAPHKGTAMRVVTDASVLAERADQSTWPTVEADETGKLRVARGPHNVVRTVSEFALEHTGVEVYIGSPSEVLATMVMLARFEVEDAELLFCDDLRRLPVWQRPGATDDAVELAATAEEMGLSVSERTAHRVLAGDITPVRQVSAVLGTKSRPAGDTAVPDIYRDRRGLKIDRADLDGFRVELERAFDAIAERYYVQLRSAPRITVGRDEIRVRFEVDKDD